MTGFGRVNCRANVPSEANFNGMKSARGDTTMSSKRKSFSDGLVFGDEMRQIYMGVVVFHDASIRLQFLSRYPFNRVTHGSRGLALERQYL